MKIGNTKESLPSDVVARATNGSRTPTAAQQPVGAVSAIDKIELSNTTITLSAPAAAASDETDLRPEKVAEVRRAIAEGKFNVSAEVVADRMISQAAELIQSVTGAGSSGTQGARGG